MCSKDSYDSEIAFRIKMRFVETFGKSNLTKFCPLSFDYLSIKFLQKFVIFKKKLKKYYLLFIM